MVGLAPKEHTQNPRKLPPDVIIADVWSQRAGGVPQQQTNDLNTTALHKFEDGTGM